MFLRSVNLRHRSIRQGDVRALLVDRLYELAWPRLENCGKAYLISSIIMANILKYITGGDNILKRQTAEEDNKTQSKRFKR